MKPAERQTRSHLLNLFQEHGFHPRTDLGQNFLIDLNLIDFVVEKADIGPEDVVLEIGAGTGGLTTHLAHRAAAVVSVEVDHRVFAFAKEETAACRNVTLLNCDALKNKNNFAPEVLDAVRARLAESPVRRLKLVANLPYCIATPVISNLVASELPWTTMVVTIQWELAARMIAEPKTDDFSALSVWLQSQCFVKVLRKLKPTVFWPRPQVDSAVIRLIPNPHGRETLGNRAFAQDFFRRLFHQRRKLLRSTLAGMYRKELTKPQIDALLKTMDFSEHVRAEELDVATLVRLASVVCAAVGGQIGDPQTESDT